MITSSWTSGTIAPGASQAATIRFAPTEERTYSGTITVNADHTSGTNTMAISGTGTRPAGPRTQFGAGQDLVNADIWAGRYYSAPSDGCYWERLRDFSGRISGVIANDFISSPGPGHPTRPR